MMEHYEKNLIPSGCERFWTEPSERATLASGLAALGAAKDDRDMLGSRGLRCICPHLQSCREAVAAWEIRREGAQG